MPGPLHVLLYKALKNKEMAILRPSATSVWSNSDRIGYRSLQELGL